MDKKTHSEMKAIEANFARERAIERLQESINTLQRSMYDMECYLEKFEAADSDLQRAEVMNWAINHLVCNIHQNLRVELLARSQAELFHLGH